MKESNRYNLLQWPAFMSSHMNLPPAPDLVPLGYFRKVLAFSPLRLSKEGITVKFSCGHTCIPK